MIETFIDFISGISEHIFPKTLTKPFDYRFWWSLVLWSVTLLSLLMLAIIFSITLPLTMHGAFFIALEILVIIMFSILTAHFVKWTRRLIYLLN